MEGRICEWCKGPITSTRANVKYCGATCRTRAGDERKKRPCLGGCGRLRFTVKGQAVTCNECRVGLSCGSVNGYKNGCRCQGCKDAVALVQREFTRKYFEEHGVSYRWRNGREGCYTGIPISRTDRLAMTATVGHANCASSLCTGMRWSSKTNHLLTTSSLSRQLPSLTTHRATSGLHTLVAMHVARTRSMNQLPKPQKPL